jgi:4a-hydroxytetrahydrobiopterin dehydratase
MDYLESDIKNLKNWKRVDNKLQRSLKFKDFVEAFGFVAKVALISEKMNHHPDLRIVYNIVDIELTTHDINSISKNDITLAGKIDELT